MKGINIDKAIHTHFLNCARFNSRAHSWNTF